METRVETAASPPTELLACYSTYPAAEAAVEHLARQEFPVENLSIEPGGAPGPDDQPRR